MSFEWTPEQDDLIRVMWIRGVSLTTISSVLSELGAFPSVDETGARLRHLLAHDRPIWPKATEPRRTVGPFQ